MFEKSKIKRILARFPRAEGKERAELLERLSRFGAAPVPMIAEELKYNRILYADAAEMFRKLYKREYIETFIQGLGETKENVRELYKDTIVNQGKSAAVPALVEHLADEDHMIRKMAGDLVAELADSSIASKIVPLVRHDSKDVKKTAMDVLSSLQSAQAAEAILPLLEDGDSWLRRKAVEALCRLKDRSVLPKLWDVVTKDRDPASMKSIIETAGEIGGPADAKALLTLVRDNDLIVRQKAAEAVARIGDSDLVPDVIDLIQDSDVNVRRAAVDILNEMKDPRTASALVRALKDGDWWVRESATEALSELGGSKISKMIMELLNDSDEYVRRAAVEFYCRVKDEAAFEDLVGLLDDEDWWVREKAITALGLIGDPRAVGKIARLAGDNEVKWAIPKALGRIGAPEAVEALSRLLKDSQRQIRLEALEALAKIDDERVVDLLKDAALGDDPETQSLALQLLKEKTGRIWLAEDIVDERKQGRAGAVAGPDIGLETPVQPGEIRAEAILVADLCNSTDLADTYGDHFAFQIMKELGDIISPIAEEEGARFSKGTGDGFLITFASVRNAVRVAKRVLDAVASRNAGVDKRSKIDLRFAVNMGETRVDSNGDRIGVAVNMAFRVESIKRSQLVTAPEDASPDAMLERNRVLLTEAACHEIESDPDFQTVFLGFFELKGITGLHRLYQLRVG